jgi:hypothetical protein
LTLTQEALDPVCLSVATICLRLSFVQPSSRLPHSL